MSVQSDHRSSPIANRKEFRSSVSGGQSRFNRLNVFENSEESTTELQNGNIPFIFRVIFLFKYT